MRTFTAVFYLFFFTLTVWGQTKLRPGAGSVRPAILIEKSLPDGTIHFSAQVDAVSATCNLRIPGNLN